LPLENVSRPPLPELVAERLLRLIESGSAPVGERLPSEAELGRQLGVGRTSIREGLQRLQTMGFVRVQRGRGAYVCEPSEAQRDFVRYSADQRGAVGDVLQVRISLEVLGAGLAAVRADEQQVAELQRHLDAHRNAHTTGDVEALIATDEAFHHCVMAAAGNPVLLSVYQGLVPALREFRVRTLSLPDVPNRSAGSHTAILDAICTRNSRAASAATLDHLLVLYNEIEAAAASTQPSSGEKQSLDLRPIFSGTPSAMRTKNRRRGAPA
jgi:GntR family transcriptional repressor for pyruvate dehydrogenase complex